MIDLAGVDVDILGVNDTAKENRDHDGVTDENYDGPFFFLSESCFNILSFPIFGIVGAKGGGGSSMIFHDCLKCVCSVVMAFISTCPLTHSNFKGVTSVMLEVFFGLSTCMKRVVISMAI